MSADPSPAAVALEAASIPHRVFVHLGPLRSLEQAAKERSQSPKQVVRSILFRLKENEYALILVAGPVQIPWKKLRAFFGQSRLTLANPEDVLAITGYPIGAVGPFGLSTPLPIYIDQGVLAQEEVSIGSGRRGTAIIISPRHLRQALPAAQVVSLFPEQ